MRLSGTLRLLGALWVNLDLGGAWSFAAAMLNAVPPNKPSATALLALLETAGYALCGQYGRQVFCLLVIPERNTHVLHFSGPVLCPIGYIYDWFCYGLIQNNSGVSAGAFNRIVVPNCGRQIIVALSQLLLYSRR
jgi:hypothetical protein